MTKSVLLLLVLVCVVIMAFTVPVSAKEGTINPDPVCDICTKLNTLVGAVPETGITDILTALGFLQTNVTALKSDVTDLQTDVSGLESDISDVQDAVDAIDCGGSGSDYTYVMYTSPSLLGEIVFDVYAPGATDQYKVTIKDWHKSGDPGSFTYSNENTCGEVTLSQFNQDITCGISGSEMKIVQIIIPKEIRDKVTFTAINDGIRITQGDFKVDYI